MLFPEHTVQNWQKHRQQTKTKTQNTHNKTEKQHERNQQNSNSTTNCLEIAHVSQIVEKLLSGNVQHSKKL